MDTDNTLTIQYTKILPQKMTKDMIKNQYGSVSYAYSSRDGDSYEVIAISDFEAPILRSKLLLDRVPFIGVDETDCKILAEVV